MHELPLSNDIENFITKPVMFFRSEFVHFMWHIASPHIIDASDFAIRKVFFNPNKSRLSVINLRSPGPVAGQTISVKLNLSEPI